MSDLGAERDGWREAWRFRGRRVAAHLANRLLQTAIIVPFATAVLRLGISLSDHWRSDGRSRCWRERRSRSPG